MGNMMSEACGGATVDANKLGGAHGDVGKPRDGKQKRKRPQPQRQDARGAKRRRGF